MKQRYANCVTFCCCVLCWRRKLITNIHKICNWTISTENKRNCYRLSMLIFTAHCETTSLYTLSAENYPTDRWINTRATIDVSESKTLKCTQPLYSSIIKLKPVLNQHIHPTVMSSNSTCLGRPALGCVCWNWAFLCLDAGFCLSVRPAECWVVSGEVLVETKIWVVGVTIPKPRLSWMCVCACVHVCVCERDRQTETERERERGGGGV